MIAARSMIAVPSHLALLALPLLAGGHAWAASPSEAARQSWREALAAANLPADGCFKADYPDRAWTRVACHRAPTMRYLPRTGAGLAAPGSTIGNTAGNIVGNIVGNGNDYAAVVTHLITKGIGSFPSITGLTSERGAGQFNTYSVQLNSNFFTTSVCNGAARPASCLGWQQFVYSNSGVAFMQYWLINYTNKCPSGGWMAYSGDCYRNSAAVGVPVQTLSQLASLVVTGSATAGGTDKMILTTATSAYTTTGQDSVVRLASGWTQSEYNVVGDGNGSEAVFNAGTTITVKIALTDGATTAPVCQSNDGTTGETNNLHLGACTTTGGTLAISFTESD